MEYLFKNFYKITKWQLITIWVAGIISMFIFGEMYSDFGNVSMVLVPFFVIFYTIGWKNSKKISEFDK